MKGIILAGGSGTRLHPLTLPISKQLLPVYDKPMIFYPLSTLMQSGIREILIISTPTDLPRFRELLGNGTQLGVEFTYREQPEPKGIPQAFIIGEDFIGDDHITLILGDNIFHGDIPFFGMSPDDQFAKIWSTQVHNPNRYGVIDYDVKGNICGIIEKPTFNVSKDVVTGLYRYPNNVIEVSKELKPSSRDEVEISDINNHYIQEDLLSVNYLDRNTVWLDAGTHKSLHQASSYVETIQERSCRMVGSPEEIAWEQGWIDTDQLIKLADKYNNKYGDYLRQRPERV